MAGCTYLLYLSENDNLGRTYFLGISDNPANLYVNALNPMTDKNTKALILKWLNRVNANLSDQEQREMDSAFMYTSIDFSYPIGDLTLYIKVIRKY
jgi:hypothetical protein